MKFILKGQEPPIFTAWKAKSNDEWQPDYGALRGNEKAAVVEALMRDQGAICCYCERRLTKGDRHIEHLVPQSDGRGDGLDFGNMLCSCQDQLRPGEPRHCGNLKGDWYDPALLVSPLDPACETRFSFLGNGEIGVAHNGDHGVRETITKLGLGIPKLNAMRKSAIDPFLDEELTVDELERFIRGYLQANETGEFGEFFTTIRFLFIKSRSEPQ